MRSPTHGWPTAALCTRWGLADLGVRLLPMSDDRVETHVVIDDPDAPVGTGDPAGRGRPGGGS